MANFEVLSLDPTTPQIRAPGAGDGYSVPRDMTFSAGTTLTAPTANITTLDATNVEVTNIKAKDGTAAVTIADSTGIVSLSANPVLSGGTANCVLYLNGSKVASSNANLVYDGTNLTATRKLIAASSGVAVSGFVDGLSVGGYDSIGFAASPATALAIGGYRTSQWSGLEFYTSGTLKAVLDSSGNLGLGVTPSAWGLSGVSALQIKNAGYWGYLNRAYMSANMYIDSAGSTKYIASDYATYYVQLNGNHSWLTAPSGTAGNAITFTQAATLDADGTWLLGTTTAPFGATSANKYSVVKGSTEGVLLFGKTNTGGGAITGNAGAGILFYTYTGTDGSETYSERARIDASGNLLVGVTSAVGRFTLQDTGTTTEITLRSSGGVGNNNRARIIGGYESGGSNYGGYLAFNTTSTSNANTEHVRITADGNVGIGTTSPVAGAKLDIAGSGSQRVYVRETGSDVKTKLVSSTTSGLLYTETNHPLLFGTNDNERARISAGGSLLVGTTTDNGRIAVAVADGTTNAFYAERTGGSPATLDLDFANAYTNWNSSVRYQIVAGGSGGVYLDTGGTSWTAVSDERKKDIIEPITNAAEKVASLRAVIGKYKTDNDGVRRSFLIAQDVQAVLPEAVDATDEDQLGLAYTDTIPLLVAAIKEQQAMIEELKAKVAQLEAR